MLVSFATLLGKLVRKGDLEVQTADGQRHRFGDGSGPPLGVRLADRAAERQLLIDPALRFGEVYMDGRFDDHQRLAFTRSSSSAPGTLRNYEELPWLRAMEQARVAFRGLHQRNDRQPGQGEHRPPL